MKRIFCQGDVCRIRQWDDMAGEFGVSGATILCDALFTAGMSPMCGKLFTIREVIPAKPYSVSKYTTYKSLENIEGTYTITGDMFELVCASNSSFEASSFADLISILG